MLTSDDRTAIHDLLAMHGHLCDSGELDRFNEVFTDDVTYDITDFGQEPLHGVAACAAAGRALGEANPVGHHVTNIVLTEQADGHVHARSKGIGIRADGSCASVTYEDTVVRVAEGWRISRRTILARRRPLGL
ncbi:3-phenylpropionate/cinnamic acid dioxygenase small subunit [Kibdelosporangium banguiense]|uniref:3-phenylpropionate/cinnamic acid dioxygenase small subunit n=1 Tax=Kibdelosporangium banguiense TaxID=1365924 RepID=A0ABS4TST4_9PSEU|nr:nuclear transport factor 2 family protein [Kibdelosporangium banguiense]MBP2327469.1 3-phenylpropionate/cinnamic acid dioxygenase small subunit [Kibdelosporangium banguiense]